MQEMSFTELLLRGMIVGVSLGAPAYVVGNMHYSARRLPKLGLAVVGGAAGLAAGLASAAGAASWPAVAVVTSVVATSSAVIFSLIPGGIEILTSRRDR